MGRIVTIGVVLGAFVLVVLAASMALYFEDWRRTPLALDESGEVLLVEKGDSLNRVARRLESRGVLKHRRLFNILGRVTGADGRIAQGEYRIVRGSTPEDLLEQLQRGDTIRYLVTIPEGLTLDEAIQLVARSEGISATLRGSDDSRLLALVAPALLPEGFFLPETYQYERGDTDLKVLTEAHRLMKQTLEDIWSRRRADIPLANSYEALILASIIEKETGQASERREIGGVFTRRLQRGMRLQTDPTVIYGLGDSFNGNLTRQHLRDASNPYNSYRRNGLPPGPIALPGRGSLMAAVQPAEGGSLYFVARGDGSHVFSETLEDHEAAVARYQLTRRADYRSAPEPGP